jgi:hypothetical protein
MLGVCVFGLAAGLVVGQTDGPRTVSPAEKKVSGHRLKGMRGAVADLEAGHVKQKDYNDRPDTPARRAFVELMKKECGVAWEPVARDRVTQDELGGYNDVMRAEIEHRFGRGVIEKLHKRAEEAK